MDDPTKELTMSLLRKGEFEARVSLQFRAFNNGLGYRCLFRITFLQAHLVVSNENNDFTVPEGSMTKILYQPYSTTWHVGLWHDVGTDQMVSNTLLDHASMYLALEIPLGMVCDYPETYEGQDGFDLLQQVPLPGTGPISWMPFPTAISSWRGKKQTPGM